MEHIEQATAAPGELRELPIESMQVLKLEAGDVVVFKCEQRIPRDAVERIKQVGEELFPGHKVAVLDGGLDIAAVRGLL